MAKTSDPWVLIKKFFRSKLYITIVLAFGIIALFSFSALIYRIGLSKLTLIILAVYSGTFLMIISPTIYLKYFEKKGVEATIQDINDELSMNQKRKIKNLVILYFLSGFLIKFAFELIYLLAKHKFSSNPLNFIISLVGTLILYSLYNKNSSKPKDDN